MAAAAITTIWYQSEAISALENHVDDFGLIGPREREEGNESEALKRAYAEITKLKETEGEIHRLRNEVTQLRAQQRQEPARLAGDLAPKSELDSYLDRIARLKSSFAEAPAAQIPELKLVREKEWLEAAMLLEKEGEEELAKAMAHLRTMAKGKAALELTRALQKYVAESGGTLPESALELEKYLPEKIDAKLLERYEVIGRGRTNDLAAAGAVLREVARPGEKYDVSFNISLLGAGYSTPPGAKETYGFSFTADEFPEQEAD